MAATYLDNGDNEPSSLAELFHVDCEVLKLVPRGLVQNQSTSSSHRVDAPQVTSRVDSWVRRLGELDLGDNRWDGHVAVAWSRRAFEGRGRGLGVVWQRRGVSCGRGGRRRGLVLAGEEAHCV